MVDIATKKKSIIDSIVGCAKYLSYRNSANNIVFYRCSKHKTRTKIKTTFLSIVNYDLGKTVYTLNMLFKSTETIKRAVQQQMYENWTRFGKVK